MHFEGVDFLMLFVEGCDGFIFEDARGVGLREVPGQFHSGRLTFLEVHGYL